MQSCWHPMPAGFGYWGLGRLSYATQGRYYFGPFDSANDKKSNRSYEIDPLKMAKLIPYYGPREKYAKTFGRDKLIKAMEKAYSKNKVFFRLSFRFMKEER